MRRTLATLESLIRIVGLGSGVAVAIAFVPGCGLTAPGTAVVIPAGEQPATGGAPPPPVVQAPEAGSPEQSLDSSPGTEPGADTGTTMDSAEAEDAPGTALADSGSAAAPDSSTPTDSSAPILAPPTVLAQDFGGGEFVAVDATRAYWTTGAGNSVLSCPLSGCAANVASLGSGMTTYGIAVDPANVYWTDYGDGLACECPLGGCNGTTILEGQGTRGDGIAVTATNIYWTFETDDSLEAGTGSIATSATDGTSTETLLAGQNYPTGLTLANGQIFWAVYGDGIVRTCTASNCAGTVMDLATGQTGPSYVAADATHVYWTNSGTAPSYDNGSVVQAALDGTGQVVLATGMLYPRGIAVDASNVYFTNYAGQGSTNGSVLRCAIGGCGGTPTVLATGQPSPVGIAVDATSVYWVDEGGTGLLQKLAK